jgi:hypothetical protein
MTSHRGLRRPRRNETCFPRKQARIIAMGVSRGEGPVTRALGPSTLRGLVRSPRSSTYSGEAASVHPHSPHPQALAAPLSEDKRPPRRPLVAHGPSPLESAKIGCPFRIACRTSSHTCDKERTTVWNWAQPAFWTSSMNISQLRPGGFMQRSKDSGATTAGVSLIGLVAGIVLGGSTCHDQPENVCRNDLNKGSGRWFDSQSVLQ